MWTCTYDRDGSSWARLLHQQLVLLACHSDADPVALRERAVPGERGFQNTPHVSLHRLLEPRCARLEPGVLPCTQCRASNVPAGHLAAERINLMGVATTGAARTAKYPSAQKKPAQAWLRQCAAQEQLSARELGVKGGACLSVAGGM